jgi:ketosteroid isomerase-like protein
MKLIMFLSAIFLAASALVNAAPRTAGHEDDEKDVENVMRDFEQAIQESDFEKAHALFTPDARWIENSYSLPVESWLPGWFFRWRDAKFRIDSHLNDIEVHVSGDVAWTTVSVESIWNADNEAARVMQHDRSKVRYLYMESEVLVRTPNGWRIALGHESMISVNLGSVADPSQQHGGMKFLRIWGGSPADKVGFKVGDVLIELGDQKIDNPNDYYNALSAHEIGDKVPVTVMRGQEKITKIVTLEGRRK